MSTTILRDPRARRAGLAVCLLAAALLACAWQRVVAPQDDDPVIELSRLCGTEEGEADVYAGSLVFSEGIAYSDVIHFDEDTIAVDLNGRISGVGSDDSLTVELHRIEYSLLDSSMGSRELSRSGSASAFWEGVGPGDYYLTLEKADDGQTITIDPLYFHGVSQD